MELPELSKQLVWTLPMQERSQRGESHKLTTFRRSPLDQITPGHSSPKYPSLTEFPTLKQGGSRPGSDDKSELDLGQVLQVALRPVASP